MHIRNQCSTKCEQFIKINHAIINQFIVTICNKVGLA